LIFFIISSAIIRRFSLFRPLPPPPPLMLMLPLFSPAPLPFSRCWFAAPPLSPRQPAARCHYAADTLIAADAAIFTLMMPLRRCYAERHCHFRHYFRLPLSACLLPFRASIIADAMPRRHFHAD
jgi:hypothetical protein